MARGIYGQRQGDEARTAAATFADRILDNQIAEGQEVAVLRRMASERQWDCITAFTLKLSAAGHSKSRIDSMLSRALAGLRF
jgi:hypothetical protein